MKPPPSRRYHELDPLDNKPGVYVLTFPEGIYIGSSKNLRSRLRDWFMVRRPDSYTTLIADDYRKTEDRLIRIARRRGLTILNQNAAIAAYHRHPRPKKKAPPLRGPRIWRWITIGGVRKPMSEWCRETGISVECALMRIRYGWGEQEAVTTRKKK